MGLRYSSTLYRRALGCRLQAIDGAGRMGEVLARAYEDHIMQESQIHVYARELWKAQGPKSIAEAAQQGR